MGFLERFRGENKGNLKEREKKQKIYNNSSKTTSARNSVVLQPATSQQSFGNQELPPKSQSLGQRRDKDDATIFRRSSSALEGVRATNSSPVRRPQSAQAGERRRSLSKVRNGSRSADATSTIKDALPSIFEDPVPGVESGRQPEGQQVEEVKRMKIELKERDAVWKQQLDCLDGILREQEEQHKVEICRHKEREKNRLDTQKREHRVEMETTVANMRQTTDELKDYNKRNMDRIQSEGARTNSAMKASHGEELAKLRRNIEELQQRSAKTRDQMEADFENRISRTKASHGREMENLYRNMQKLTERNKSITEKMEADFENKISRIKGAHSEELEKLGRFVKEAEKRNDMTRHKMEADMDRRIAGHLTAIQRRDGTITGLRAELDETKRTMKETQSSLNTATATLTERTTALEENELALRRARNELNANMLQLNSLKKTSTDETTLKNKQFEIIQQQCVDLQQQLNESRAKINEISKAKDQETQRLALALSEKEEILLDLKQETANLQRHEAMLEARVQTQSQDLTEMSKRCEEKEKGEVMLEQRLRTQDQDLAEMSRRCEEKEQLAKDWEGKFSKLREQIASSRLETTTDGEVSLKVGGQTRTRIKGESSKEKKHGTTTGTGTKFKKSAQWIAAPLLTRPEARK